MTDGRVVRRPLGLLDRLRLLPAATKKTTQSGLRWGSGNRGLSVAQVTVAGALPVENRLRARVVRRPVE